LFKSESNLNNILKFLSLRNNLIKSIEGLENCINLEELELYDNKIVKIENLENLKKLR
jgi:protein phosphatase 1 regulatory subunit 7